MRLQNGDVLFLWPLAIHVITSGWTYNSSKAHNAIDLRAAEGTPVYAAAWQSIDSAPNTEERLEALDLCEELLEWAEFLGLNTAELREQYTRLATAYMGRTGRKIN